MYTIKNLNSLPDNFNEVEAVPKNNNRSSQTINFHPLILIVEDDDDTRIMMKYLLNLWRYRIIEAVNGAEGLQMAEDFQPDVILMDYNLPNIDGLTASKMIRALPAHTETPIIFISAFSEQSVRVAARAAGANDFLVKPINFGELENSLKTHLKKTYKSNQNSIGGTL